MRLAERLGKTLRELDADLGPNELRLWMAKDLIEPSGERRADLRAGSIMALQANLNRDSDVRPEPFSPLDFVMEYPYVEDPGPTQEELDAKIDAVFGPRSIS